MTTLLQPITKSTFRFELVNSSGLHLGDITVARDQPPTMSVDTSRSLKRTLRGMKLPPGELLNIDLIKDRVDVSQIFPDESSSDLGRFMFTSPTEEAFTAPIFDTADLLSGGEAHWVTIDLVDQCMIIDQETTSAVTVRPGTNVTDFLTTFLASYPVNVVVDPSLAVVGSEALTWPPATSGLRIVNELAAMLGYTELYFDNDHVGRLRPFPDPTAVAPFTVLDLTGRIIRPTVTRGNNLLDLPNRFIVVGSGATNQPVVGVYDIPDSAPHSALNRGFVVAHSEQLQGIDTAAQATTAAQAFARQNRFAYETVSLTTPIDARFDHYDVVSIETIRFLETSWEMTLAEGGGMRHSMRRTYEVL